MACLLKMTPIWKDFSHNQILRPYVKDAFHRYLIQWESQAINPDQDRHQKQPLIFIGWSSPQETWTMHLRLSSKQCLRPFFDFESLFDTKKKEADVFYAADSKS